MGVAFAPAGISDAANALLSHAWAPSTARQIAAAWRRFAAYCAAQHREPDRADDVLVVNWLTAEFHLHPFRWTWFSHMRSAVSTKLAWLLGRRLGDSPMVTTLIKAIQKFRPSQPHYVEGFYDPAVIATCLRNGPAVQALDDRDLVGHVVVLLYLTGLRIADMNRTAVARCVFDDTAHRVTLVTHTKEQPAAPWVAQRVEGVPEESRVCPHCLCRELARRRAVAHAETFFWNQRTAGRVSNDWLRSCAKRIMAAAGIDTANFPVHSLRGAGASKALEQGVPEHTVRQAFRWAPTSKTLDKYYNRARPRDSLAAVVLADRDL